LIGSLLAALVLEGTLLVANKTGDSVTFFDLGLGKEVARVAVGRAPHELAVSPDGRTVLVPEYGPESAHGSTVAILDVIEARVTGRIDVGPDSRPHSIAFLGDGNRAAVTLQESDVVAILDLRTRSVERRLGTGGRESHMVRLSPDGGRAYVTSRLGAGTLSILDLAAEAKPVVIPTGAGAEGLAVTPDGSEVWVLDRSADTISIVDTARLSVKERLPVRPSSNRVAISSSGKAVVTNGTSSEALAQFVDVYDVRSRSRLHSLPLRGGAPGKGAFGIWIQGGSVFISDTAGGRVLVYDLERFDEPKVLLSGLESEGPDGMVVSALRVEPRSASP
jgi:DNA-binding beta-propeller fold protein YncE